MRRIAFWPMNLVSSSGLERRCSMERAIAIGRLEDLRTFARRERKREHRRQGEKRQTEFEQIGHPPVAPCEQRRCDHPGNGRCKLGNADADEDAGDSLGRGHRLHPGEDPQRRKSAGGKPAKRAEQDRRPEVMHEQVHQCRKGVTDQHQLDEERQAILLAEFHQDQVGADIGCRVGCGNPGRLLDGEAKRSLEISQVRDDQGIAEAAGHARQQPDDRVANHSPGGMFRIIW
jgi:hypothetical protein